MISLKTPQQKRASSRLEGRTSLFFSSCGRFLLSYCKDVKDPFQVKEGMCDFPQEAAAEKGLISPGGENIQDFLEFQQVPLELRPGPQGPARMASGKASDHASREGCL